MTTLLLAEDDRAIADPLARALRRAGFAVCAQTDGLAALATAQAGAVDLLILDLSLPGLDGVELCRRLRAGGARLPIVMLTARDEEMDIVVGLDAGADDYIVKPFRVAEVLARVRAQLRGSAPRAVLESGPGPARVRLDADARRAWLAGVELTLTAREFDLLAALLRAPGRTLSRAQLVRDVWRDRTRPESRTLDVHIAMLRRKLGDDAAHPRYIATERGAGFRFLGP